MIIYLAGPLFSEAERAWIFQLKTRIIELAARIGVEVDARWPWDFVPPDVLQAHGDKAGEVIFQACVSNLKAADILIALLDGAQVDDGTAWEIGYFFRHRSDPGKPIIGVRTDIRNAGECASSLANAMIEHSCARIVRSQDETITILEKILSEKPE